MAHEHTGTDFDTLLEEESLLAEAGALALKRVFAWELQKVMDAQNLSKRETICKIGTSHAVFNRLFDPENTSVSLKSLERGAIALRTRVHIKIYDLL